MTPDFCTLVLSDGTSRETVHTRTEERCAFGSVAVRREGEELRIVLTPDRPVRAESIRLVLTEDLRSADRIFLNGYQSWTDSREYPPDGRMRGLAAAPGAIVKRYSLNRFGDYTFTEYPNRRGCLHGWSFGAVRRGETFRLFASLSEADGFTLFRTDTGAGRITAEKETADRLLPAGESVTLLRLFLAEGTGEEVFDRWFAALSIPKPSAPPAAGYTSWYRHYQNISEKKLLRDLEGVRACGAPFGVFQIDDGWEQAVGDWLVPDAAKFPSGMRSMRDAAADAGLLPGLWLAPFVAERKSALVREHPDWFLRDERGGFLSGGCNWSGICILSFYNPEVRGYLRRVFSTVVGEWGFSFLKLDFLYAVCLAPPGGRTRGGVMCEAMQFLRSCTNGARLLGCGVPMMPAFGLVDYCRIGCDVGLSWDDRFFMRLLHRERVSTKNSIRNSVFRRWLNGRAFLCDPDVFLLRRDGNTLTAEQRRALTFVNALCGGVFFTSDDPSQYDESQKTTLAQALALRGTSVLSAAEDGGALTLRIAGDGREETLRFPL